LAKGFQNGHKKVGTRKGAPNKITLWSREWISAFLSTEKERKLFESDWELMEPRERVQARLKLVEYITPKPATVQPDTGDSGKTYEVIWV